MQIDHQRMYTPITKWTAELKTGEVYGIMKKATEIALAEQPGPVHLDFPEDVAEELSGEDAAAFRPAPGHSPMTNQAEESYRSDPESQAPLGGHRPDHEPGRGDPGVSRVCR